MSSRQEEKEKRRREREEREAHEKASAARRRRLQMVFGAILAIVVLGAAGGVVYAVTSGGGDSSTKVKGGAAIPDQSQGDEKKAAAAAGCTLKENLAIEGNTHETKTFSEKDYKTNPPTSGNHYPQWADDGIYDAGKQPQLGMLVHPLEHGRIEIQYKPGTPATTVSQLETLYNSLDSGHHMLMFENTTNMPYAVAATSWGDMLGCNTMNDKVFDAIRTFREAHIDKGPEVVP